MGAERLVVIGGDAGGMSAASQARRLRPADDLVITAFERGQHVSYSACGIPYLVGGLVTDAEHLVARTPEEFRTGHAIDVFLGHEVVGIDTERGCVRVRPNDGGPERDEGYDHLMIATGARPVRPPIPGIDSGGIFGVQTLDHGIAILEALKTRVARRAVVVGAGYIGIEMAEAAARRGLDVVILDKATQPMPSLDADIGALLGEGIRGAGIDLRLGVGVEGFETGPDGWVQWVATDAGAVPADIVILGLGVRPDGRLANEAGIAVGATGGVRTDRRQRTSAERVWAAGDCTETTHRITGEHVAIALGTHANKQGRVAGTNIGRGYAVFPGVIGTAMSKVCAFEVARTGLGEEEAKRAGFAVRAVVVDSSTRASYYPGSKLMTVKLVVELRTGRLLGAQIVGEEGAAKRIDVLAVCVWNAMTVEEMAGLDLSYAPPFSPVWDPVVFAARTAAGL